MEAAEAVSHGKRRRIRRNQRLTQEQLDAAINGRQFDPVQRKLSIQLRVTPTIRAVAPSIGNFLIRPGNRRF